MKCYRDIALEKYAAEHEISFVSGCPQWRQAAAEGRDSRGFKQITFLIFVEVQKGSPTINPQCREIMEIIDSLSF